jgi:hypothetical protein
MGAARRGGHEDGWALHVHEGAARGGRQWAPSVGLAVYLPPMHGTVTVVEAGDACSLHF